MRLGVNRANPVSPQAVGDRDERGQTTTHHLERRWVYANRLLKPLASITQLDLIWRYAWQNIASLWKMLRCWQSK